MPASFSCRCHNGRRRMCKSARKPFHRHLMSHLVQLILIPEVERGTSRARSGDAGNREVWKCACRECLRACTSSIPGEGVIWSLVGDQPALAAYEPRWARYHVSPTGAGRSAAPRMRSSAAYAARGVAFQLICFVLLCGALFNEGRISARHNTIRRGLSSPIWYHPNASLRCCVGEGAAIAHPLQSPGS